MDSAGPRRRDRRRARHEATKQEILDAAWAMVRAGGLNALSLRALAHDLDMEPQSLYTYFPSKHAVYDHLFAAGNRELLDRFQRIETSDDPRHVLRQIAHLFVSFAADEPARYELLFMRTVPDFEPSPESYALAVDVVSQARSALAALGSKMTPTSTCGLHWSPDWPTNSLPTIRTATVTHGSSTTPSPCSLITFSVRASRGANWGCEPLD